MRSRGFLRWLTLAAVLGAGTPGFAADPGKPVDSTKSVDASKSKAVTPGTPQPIPMPYPNTPKTLAPSLQPPSVSGYSPARVVPGETVSVLGLNLGDDAAGRQMRVAGNAYSQTLTVVRWTPGEVQVRLPADIRPGRYYIAVADASSRWLSNLERSLEVVDPLRRLPVRLDVTAGCSYDVASPAPTVTLRLQGAGGGAPLTLALRSTGARDGAQGARIFGYEGQLAARVGSYQLAAIDAPFTAAMWDYINGNARPIPGGSYIERTNWDDCYVHRRITSWGALLPAPQRQTYGVGLRQERLDLTVAIDAIRLEGYPSVGGGLPSGASLPPPTPVCPPEGCR
jgi:hypothetical protein